MPHLRRLLGYASSPNDILGVGLHYLKGKRKGFWSATVSGNWRVIFRFVHGDVEMVDYLDYL
ncbi:hypothetical protein GRH90_25290 [Enterobacteriales bacterium SAP-6]|uniref:Killer protein n=1 Tax=Acerihabitans arboris TaxID=2691583 RepID=A0A845SL84_9GAMM|nr:hypothetical protein [Acerihabitans arboris]